MPAVFDAKYFNAEVFGKYVDIIPRLKRNELLKSRAVVVNDRIKSMMNEQTGGNIITIPILGRIGGTPDNYDGQTDITDETTDTYMQTRVVAGRAKGWTEKDFSYDISGGVNFMDNVAKQVSEYWDDVDQDVLLAILKGVFSMTGAKNLEFVNDHTMDISKEDINTFGVTTLNNALQKAVGQNKAKFSLAIMHSQVATNLENLQLLEYLKYTDKNGVQRDLTLATLNGRAVLIDDSMPTEVAIETISEGEGENVTTKEVEYINYTTYVLGEGAFEFTDAGVKVPYEMDRNPKINGGQDTLYSRQRLCYCPFGISFTNQVMKTASPTNTELENTKNWELVKSTKGNVIDHKAIPIARIITRG